MKIIGLRFRRMNDWIIICFWLVVLKTRAIVFSVRIEGGIKKRLAKGIVLYAVGFLVTAIKTIGNCNIVGYYSVAIMWKPNGTRTGPQPIKIITNRQQRKHSDFFFFRSTTVRRLSTSTSSTVLLRFSPVAIGSLTEWCFFKMFQNFQLNPFTLNAFRISIVLLQSVCTQTEFDRTIFL